jgi:hypothetical protein
MSIKPAAVSAGVGPLKYSIKTARAMATVCGTLRVTPTSYGGVPTTKASWSWKNTVMFIIGTGVFVGVWVGSGISVGVGSGVLEAVAVAATTGGPAVSLGAGCEVGNGVGISPQASASKAGTIRSDRCLLRVMGAPPQRKVIMLRK